MEKKQETQAAERVSGAVVADPAPASLPAVRRPDSIGAALVGSKRERETVAAFLNMNADDPALFGVMAIAKAYNLSPFLGELFVIDQKVKFRDATGKKVEKYVKKPGAGRDGFLSVAHKSGVHRGLQSDVVCALDSFDVRWDVYPNGQPIPPEDRPFIAHRHAPLRPGGSVADARRYRGAIIGAWAKVSRSDQLPFFFFAPLSEHGKTWTSEDGQRSGWSGAWTYTSAMIVKAASSYALRIAYSITGVVPTDELRGNDPIFELPDGPSVEQWQDAPDAVPDDIPEAVQARLKAAVEDANELDPTAWPAAKCELVFAGRSPEELDRLAGDIEREVEARRKMRARASGEPEPEPADAEVVGHPEEARVVEGEELRRRIREAQTRAGAAQSESEHAEALEELASLEAELADLGEPGAIDPE